MTVRQLASALRHARRRRARHDRPWPLGRRAGARRRLTRFYAAWMKCPLRPVVDRRVLDAMAEHAPL